MNPDHLLHDVFAAAADTRPDPDEVLAAVHERIDRPRRATVGRTATVLGAAAAVAAVATTAAVLTGEPGRSTSAGPAGSAPTSSSAPPARSTARTTATPPASSTPATSPAPSLSEALPPHAIRQGSEYDYSTIAAGWLPGKGRQIEASNRPGFEERDYDVNVDGTSMDVIIYVESGTSLPKRTEAGRADRDLVINGHPAREFVADVATIVAINLGNGKIAYAGPSVVATTSRVTTARITRIAEHVARDIQYGRHDPIPS